MDYTDYTYTDIHTHDYIMQDASTSSTRHRHQKDQATPGRNPTN